MNDYKKEMTVRHLLTMTSGLDWAEWFSDTSQDNPYYELYRQEDWPRYILNRKVITKPGIQFNYNSGNSHLLNVILSGVLGGTLPEFADKNLFSPLGITDYTWAKDPGGILTGGVSLFLKPRDMAKLGYLYLNNGVWNGARLLPKQWVENAGRDCLADDSNGYGYQFWTIYPDLYAAYGYGGQIILVIPDNKMIIVTTGFSYNLINLFPQFMEALGMLRDQPVEEDPSGYKILQNLLADLSSDEVIRQRVPDSIKNLVGREIKFDGNRSYVRSLMITDIHGDEIELEFRYLDPFDGREYISGFTAGMDNKYRLNKCPDLTLSTPYFFPEYVMLYPDPDEYQYAFRVTFPSRNAIEVDYLVPGSVLDNKFTLTFNDDSVFLEDAVFAKDNRLKGGIKDTP